MDRKEYDLLVEKRNKLDKKIKEYESIDDNIQEINYVLNRIEGEKTIERIVVRDNENCPCTNVFMHDSLGSIIKESIINRLKEEKVKLEEYIKEMSI